MKELSDRLEHFSDRSGDCWIWIGQRNQYGYGQIHVAGRCVVAHRVSYELHIGPIPDGLELDHLCRERACINPGHLEPVTKSENQRRSMAVIGPRGVAAINAAKTHCARGHEFTPENTYVWRGGRRCRACDSARRRRSQART